MRTLSNINERYPKEFAKLPAIIAESIRATEGEDYDEEGEDNNEDAEKGDDESAIIPSSANDGSGDARKKPSRYPGKFKAKAKLAPSPSPISINIQQSTGRILNAMASSNSTDNHLKPFKIHSRRTSAIPPLNNQNELDESENTKFSNEKHSNDDGVKPDINIPKFQPFPLQPNSTYSLKKLSKRQLAKMPQSIKSRYLAYEQPNEKITLSISESAARAHMILEKEWEEKIKMAQYNRRRLLLLRGVIEQEYDFIPHMELAQQRMQDKVSFVKSAKVKTK
jgi:hypothetical protein